MRKILVASAITALILTACAAPQGKTTVSQAVSQPEPTAFVLNIRPLPYIPKALDKPKETPTVKIASVEEEQESSVSPFLVAHMVKNDLPEATATKYANYILEASDETGIDPFEILSVIHIETGGTFRFKDHPNSHGAIGLMQILKRNADWMGVEVQDLYDPKTNIMLGSKYLKQLQERFGHDLGITAYNWGEGNVSKGKYTQGYYNRVHEVFKNIEGNDYAVKASATN